MTDNKKKSIPRFEIKQKKNTDKTSMGLLSEIRIRSEIRSGSDPRFDPDPIRIRSENPDIRRGRIRIRIVKC